MRALGLLVVTLLLLQGCTSVPDTESQTSADAAAGPTAEPTPAPSLTMTPSPTSTAIPTATAMPTTTAAGPTATATATATAAIPTATAVPSAPAAIPTATAVPSAAPSPTSTSAPLATPDPNTTTSDPTVTPAPEPTATPTVQADPSSVPLDENGEKGDLAPSGYTGDVLAIRTQNGVVVPVRSVTGDEYVVVTPCYNLASITGGLAITGPIDVLIDPGHGGDEPGAVGPNGLKESTVNLQVSELLRAELIDRGYRVELTRYSDHRVAIQARAELANALAPTVFVSIHHNGGFPEPFPVAGTEVFVQLDDPESARLGGIMFEEIQRAFADLEADWMGNLDTFGVAWRQNDEGTDLYGVLRRTPGLVSVLTEAMFISTESEAELLAQPEVLEIEAQALANALERWFTTQDPGSGFVDGVVFRGDLGNGGGLEGCVDPQF